MSEEAPQYGASERSTFALSTGSGNPAAAARHDGETLSRDADISPLTPYYQDALCTIYHGDCRVIMPNLKGYDLLLCDPPYGIGIDTKATKQWKAKSAKWQGARLTKDYGQNEWDSEPVEEWVMFLARRLCEWQIIFGGNFYELPSASCWLIWDKENGENTYADCEMAWTNLAKAVRRLRYLWNGFQKSKPEERYHPTQKPLDVMAWALRQAPPEVRTVLDPWMGSGTTLRACKDAGKLCVGIEREERYCEIAATRLAQESFQFAGSDADFGVTDSNISSQAELLDSPND